MAEPHGGTAAKHAKARELLYGCQDGRLVQLLVDAGAVRQGFVIHGAPGSKQGMRSAVTAIHCGADYSKVRVRGYSAVLTWDGECIHVVCALHSCTTLCAEQQPGTLCWSQSPCAAPDLGVLQTGCADIVVGREDGSLEVWDIDPQGQPQLVVSTNLPESITAVDGGYITNASSPDIIVQTFTGKVSQLPGLLCRTHTVDIHSATAQLAFVLSSQRA